MTLPVIIGEKNAAWHATFFMLLSVIVLFIPFLQPGPYYLDPLFIPFAITAAYITLLCLPSAYQAKDLERVRRNTLAAMGIALVGFLIGALF